MPKKVFIDKEKVPVTKIKEEIKVLERNTKELNKLYFILEMYYGSTVKNTCEKYDINLQTGYLWIKKWNKYGIEGFIRKEGSGVKSKLSEEDFDKLDKLIQEKNLATSRQVKKLIEDEFNVNYSERHVRRLMKKLGYGYGKPYRLYDEKPEDADEQLKKT